MRRLAQLDSAYLVPHLSEKTFYWRLWAEAKLFQRMINRDAPLPTDNLWPPLRAPVSIVLPTPRPAANQLPPATPRATTPLQQQLFKPLPRPPLLTQSATIVGPRVGERGSANEVVLRHERTQWQQTKPPARPLPDASATQAAVLVLKLAGCEFFQREVRCPNACCRERLLAEVPDGFTQVASAANAVQASMSPSLQKRRSGSQAGSRRTPTTAARRESRAG